ncbi:hypothetical protein [Microbacterium sp. P04]|uniref:hypothetical protein n=1 Tax=Microbacterium sp. P04 TaxID=3366947 RepID=UPI0037459D89
MNRLGLALPPLLASLLTALTFGIVALVAPWDIAVEATVLAAPLLWVPALFTSLVMRIHEDDWSAGSEDTQYSEL